MLKTVHLLKPVDVQRQKKFNFILKNNVHMRNDGNPIRDQKQQKMLLFVYIIWFVWSHAHDEYK